MFDEELISWSVDGGGYFFYRPKHKFSITNVSGFIRLHSTNWNYKFLFYLLDYQHQFLAFDYQTKAHPSVIKFLYYLVPLPIEEQAKIAEILSYIDTAIEQTEAIIAKQQRIKTGLMQDLLSKGIDEHGNIRSEHTHAFKDSPLGRIPVEWEVLPFGDLIESATDGPFGSNLKTEHYVAEPGVRVLRLQNIGNGNFIDLDKVWISSEHAKKLSRHSALQGDLLIASLGDERHPIGRACLYPLSQSTAIVKADVFRVQCKADKINHSFVSWLLNFPRWRSGLFGLVQGVTRDRVNLSNLKLLQIPVPDIKEQLEISLKLDFTDKYLTDLKGSCTKLKRKKTALMQDLLSGKVRVNDLLDIEESCL